MSFVPKRVVLDTNTIISAAINPNSISGVLYLHTLRYCDLYRSDQAKHVVVTKIVTRCIDPKDNMFLALAEAISAHYLVSGNIKHLNVLIDHAGTPIVTNRQFLADVAPSLLMN